MSGSTGGGAQVTDTAAEKPEMVPDGKATRKITVPATYDQQFREEREACPSAHLHPFPRAAPSGLR